MPTVAERQALAFLAGVALLGGGVQVWRGREQRAANAAQISGAGETVDAQLRAIDSARASQSGRKRATKAPAKPSVRSGSTARSPRKTNVREEPPLLVDVDVASADELERLPRIGPALAARIVANRDSLGAFGSLEEFGRVRGVGPATLKLLQPVTTFSGRVRSRAPPARDR